MIARLGLSVQVLLLGALYLFLYGPIIFIVHISFQVNSVWPFPPEFTTEHYRCLWREDDYHTGLANSLIIGIGTGVISSLFATMAAMAALINLAVFSWLSFLGCLYVLLRTGLLRLDYKD